MIMMHWNIRTQKGAKGKRGFTLIELIVSTGIFAIASTLIVGALLSVEYASKKTRMIRVASDNLSAALDNMGRTIRLGSNLHCGCTAASVNAAAAALNDTKNPTDVTVNCPRDTLGASGSSNLCLEKQDGDTTSVNKVNDQVMYRLNSGKIQRSLNNGATFEDLTADNITVTNLKFHVRGATFSRQQPYVTILVSAVVGVGAKEKTVFNIQTTVAQRTPNNQ